MSRGHYRIDISTYTTVTLWSLSLRFNNDWEWFTHSWIVNRPPVYSYTAWWLRLGPIAIAWRW